MKKSAIFILVLLIVPVISAVEFDMKSNFSQGETLMAKVSGNFLEPILKENIFFYKDRHIRIPLEYDVGKIGDEFYIYALLSDKKPYNNYSLIIKNVRYMKGSKISEEEIIKDFAITEETSDFSINPGFIITKKNFFIEVQNLQESKITIQTKMIAGNKTSNEDEIDLISGEIKKINFEINTGQKFKTIELRTGDFAYTIPVYTYIETESEKKEKSFNFDPSELNISIPTNSNTTRIIYLHNTGKETLKNISLLIADSLSSYVNISINEIEELEEDSNIKIELYIFSKEEREINGYIKAQAENKSLFTYSDIYLNFLKDYVPPKEEVPITKTCSEMNGSICSRNEECSGEQINAKDTVCCIGTCKEKKESPIGLIIGIGMLIFIVGFVAWFFIKKYRGTKKPVDLLKIAKGKRPEPQRTPQTRKIEHPPIRRNISQPINRPIQQRKYKIPKTIVRYVEKPVIKEIERIVEKPVIKEVEKIIEKPVIKEVEKKVFIEKPKRPAPIKFKYKASTESQTYHKTSCRLAKLIKPKYKITNNNVNYFKKKGYKPCKVCLG